MLKITLEGPQASGKTLMHNIIKERMQEVVAKTGHEITVIERNPEQVGADARPRSDESPRFKVFLFRPSGKFDDEFVLDAPNATSMRDVINTLRQVKTLKTGYSMVIAASENQKAEDMFYPVTLR